MTRPADEAPKTIVADKKTWIQVREAARRLDLTTGRIYHLVADGRLESRHHLGLLYLEQGTVARYQEYQRQLRHLRTKMSPLSSIRATGTGPIRLTRS